MMTNDQVFIDVLCGKAGEDNIKVTLNIQA